MCIINLLKLIEFQVLTEHFYEQWTNSDVNFQSMLKNKNIRSVCTKTQKPTKLITYIIIKLICKRWSSCYENKVDNKIECGHAKNLKFINKLFNQS